MMVRITAPAGTRAHGADVVHQPDTLWWVEGVTYVNEHDPRAERFRRKGFTVEPGEPDAGHLSVVAQMETAAAEQRSAGPLHDAAEPARRSYTDDGDLTSDAIRIGTPLADAADT